MEFCRAAVGQTPQLIRDDSAPIPPSRLRRATVLQHGRLAAFAPPCANACAVFRRCGRPLGVFHNSVWSFRIARKLACGSPYLIGLTPRCFAHRARASCAPRASSRFAAFDCALRAASVRPSPLHPFGASTAAACFAHCARPSCAPFAQGRLWGSATPCDVPLTKRHTYT